MVWPVGSKRIQKIRPARSFPEERFFKSLGKKGNKI